MDRDHFSSDVRPEDGCLHTDVMQTCLYDFDVPAVQMCCDSNGMIRTRWAALWRCLAPCVRPAAEAVGTQSLDWRCQYVLHIVGFKYVTQLPTAGLPGYPWQLLQLRGCATTVLSDSVSRARMWQPDMLQAMAPLAGSAALMDTYQMRWLHLQVTMRAPAFQSI